MPDNPTTALVKANQSPSLARVSNQLALTDKLLTKPEEPFLIPYRKRNGYAADSGGWGFDNYWAFCNENGQIVLEQFCYAGPFVAGLAIVGDIRYAPKGRSDSDDTYFYYGFINTAGELLISYKFYENILPFSEGLAMVIGYAFYGGDNMVGFIDRNGQEVIPCIYNNAFGFSEGLAAVKIDKYHKYDDYSRADEHWGFVNTKGDVVISLEFKKVKSFSEKLSAVLSRSNYNWGYIDMKGQVVIPMQYVDAKSFSADLAAVVKYKYDPDLDDGLEPV